ncbi:Myotubularin-like protein [Phytophthora cinnamomi]|uniref:Myotubularin-like protein n=1 Tax=Phytophthora cinnamomi TaxID=4785 RepID=UPI003559E70E|nr:Myotubularin-like protein [Phytophthora cinnamomi]
MEETAGRPTAERPEDVEAEADDLLTDSGRNWSADVLLQLVKIWRRVFLAHPDWSRVQRMQAVYDAFQQCVDCSQRSRKAVDDKLYSMKQMYQFIAQVKDQFKQGGPDKAPSPSWFELTKEERRVVRTLHRVRIPDISLDVYNVFDSVLSPSAVAARKALEGNLISASAASAQGSTAVATTPLASAPNDDAQEITQEILDVKRNWSYDVTLQLARVWNNVHRENPALRGATLSLNVYNAFMAAVGGSNRSRKAVDDKMHSMREMYRFMKNYETKRITTGEPKIPWFDLTKPERRAVRAANKIRVPNLAPDVYNEIDMLMTRMNQISPSDTPIESASTSVPSVDLEGSQHNSNFATSTFIVNNSNAVAGQLSQNNGATANGQPGQLTCECGAKRLLDIAPATMTITTSNSGNSNVQLQQQQPLQGGRPAPIVTAQNIQVPANYYSTQQIAGQGTPKRQRTTQEQQVTTNQVTAGVQAMASAGMVDAQSAHDFMEQMRASLAQDREERRQQHAEQMSALREIAALLKQRR